MKRSGLEKIESDLRSMLSYDAETGKFTWLVTVNSQGGQRKPGDVAGFVNDQGYRIIGCRGKVLRAHRLAYFYMTGKWPPRGVDMDHLNGDRDDNRWSNLRICTRSENNLNSGVRCNNVSGVSGVSWVKRDGTWAARITVDKKLYLLGEFADKEDAIAARRAAEARLVPDAGPNRSRPARPRHQ